MTGLERINYPDVLGSEVVARWLNEVPRVSIYSVMT